MHCTKYIIIICGEEQIEGDEKKNQCANQEVEYEIK